jgi:hypothetical protein
MTKFIQYLLVTASFLIIISCVGQKPFAFNNDTQPTEFDGGGTDCGTNSALIVSAVASPQPAVLSNGTVAVTITVTAYGYCDKYQMTSPTQAPTTTFTRTQTFQKSYTTAGSYPESIGVNALNASNAVVDHKDITLTVVVQDSGPPPNDPPPTCAIERRGSVADTNALVPVALTATGTITNSYMKTTYTSFTSVVLGQTYGAVPDQPGLYNVFGKVVDNKAREATCDMALFTPTTEIQAISTTYNSVLLRMVLHGPISVGGVKIDGVVQNLPSNGNVIDYDKPHTAGPGKFTSLGEVMNLITGDRGSATTAQYCIPHIAIAATGDFWSNTYYQNQSGGYAISSTNNRIVAGYRWMTWTGSTWGVRTLERDFNTQLKTTTTTTAPSTLDGQCPADHVMIGYTSARLNICAKLVSTASGAKVKLINPTQQSNFINEGGASMFTCPAGQVLTGQDTYNSGGWRYRAYCATPVWEECQ